MYKTNISESLQFLVFCREALAQIIDVSSMSSLNKANTKNFLFNEATDYQIISLIVRGELPSKKYDIFEEVCLFDELKAQVLSNIDLVSEYVDEDSIGTFLMEVDAVSLSSSSARPVLEFLMEAGNSAEGTLTPTKITHFTRLWAGKAEKTAKELPDNVQQLARDALVSASKKYDNAQDAVKAAARTFANRVKIGAAKFMQDTDPQLDRLRAQKGNLGAGTADLGTSQKAMIQKSIEKSGEAYKNRPTGQKIGDSIMAFINRQKHRYPNASAAVQDIFQKAKDFSQTGEAKAIAAAALIALISFASYKVYKAKFSQAAKACKGTAGAEKKACMAKFKRDALMAQAQDMQKATAGCAKTKDPAKCKAALFNKISKLKAKAAKIK